MQKIRRINGCIKQIILDLLFLFSIFPMLDKWKVRGGR